MKKLIIGILIVVLLTTWCHALAEEVPAGVKTTEWQKIMAAVGVDGTERIEVHKAHILPMQTRFLCTDCYEHCMTVCLGDAIHYDTGMHGNCEVFYFNSRGILQCPFCEKVWKQYGYHDCWEVHKSCYKGRYDVCPMEDS